MWQDSRLGHLLPAVGSLTTTQTYVIPLLIPSLSTLLPGAVTFTNPFEVIKTRLQLQGELLKRNAQLVLPYRNVAQAFVVVARSEGISGLQKGLAPAYAYQCILNGNRLGLYEPLKHVVDDILHISKGHPLEMVSMMLSGAVSGIAGAFFASPLFLIKTVKERERERKGWRQIGRHVSLTFNSTPFALSPSPFSLLSGCNLIPKIWLARLDINTITSIRAQSRH